MTHSESANGEVVEHVSPHRGWRQVREIGVLFLPLLLICGPLPGTTLMGQAVPETWMVSEQPRLRIGLESGPEEYLFDYVRGVVPLPEGRLAVADAGYLTVRVYDTDGRYLYRMGGPGQGPGEFSGIYGLWLTEDGTLAVWDDEALRIAQFGPSGEHRETTRVQHDLEQRGNLQVFFGPLTGGEVLLGALMTVARRPGERGATPYLLFRYHLSGELRAAVGEAEGSWRYHRADGSVISLPFTPVPWAATWNDTIYLAAGYGAGVEVRDRQGTLVRTLPVPGRRTASESDWAAFRSTLRERAEDLPIGAFYLNALEQGGGCSWTTASRRSRGFSPFERVTSSERQWMPWGSSGWWSISFEEDPVEG